MITNSYTITDEKRSLYLDYIMNHRNKVKKAYFKYAKELCEAVGVDMEKVDLIITLHDNSKFSNAEFAPYVHKFYPVVPIEEQTEEIKIKIETEFNRAWLHHIHYNPHHPEYWILFDGHNTNILDMPSEYIVEMLCDWQSFAKEDGSGGAYDFYYKKDNKEGLLSDKTRELVEKGLEVLKPNK